MIKRILNLVFVALIISTTFTACAKNNSLSETNTSIISLEEISSETSSDQTSSIEPLVAQVVTSQEVSSQNTAKTDAVSSSKTSSKKQSVSSSIASSTKTTSSTTKQKPFTSSYVGKVTVIGENYLILASNSILPPPWLEALCDNPNEYNINDLLIVRYEVEKNTLEGDRLVITPFSIERYIE